ncbi:MAG: DoxX family membrane protein [Flavobacteriales bacterium]|nr:DoxX family membrane protein [Flavobacteriales bacterium]
MRSILLTLVHFCRMVVGSLLVISGLIKSNDARGFMYKLEEYFEPGALNLEAWAPYALELGITASVGEILLGVALLVGALPRLTTALTTVLLLFFGWLTFYTHSCDPFGMKTIVVDGVATEIANQCVLACGCFGNAIPLTPWESFLKDVFLLVLTLPILWAAWTGGFGLNDRRRATVLYTGALLSTWLFGDQMLEWGFPVLFLAGALLIAEMIRRRVGGRWREYAMAGGVLLLAVGFQSATLRHLPLKDYRPYAAGQSIVDNRKTADELGVAGPVYATEYAYRNVISGADTIVLSSDYIKIYNEPWFKSGYELVSFDGAEVKVSDGYEPLISDLDMMDAQGFSHLESFLGEGVSLWHISKDLGEAHTCAQPAITGLCAEAEKLGWRVAGLTASMAEEVEEYRFDYQAAYPFYTTDPTELKIVIRSNPGVVLIQNGVVLGKWGWRDVPTIVDLRALVSP